MRPGSCFLSAKGAVFIRAWGNAPGKAVDTKPSAEGAIQSSVETRFQRSFTMQYGAPGALPQAVMSRRFQRQTYPLVVR